jgi:hypothetical protein
MLQNPDMEEIIISLLENSIALAVLGFAWRLVANRYVKERKAMSNYKTVI